MKFNSLTERRAQDITPYARHVYGKEFELQIRKGKGNGSKTTDQDFIIDV